MPCWDPIGTLDEHFLAHAAMGTNNSGGLFDPTNVPDLTSTVQTDSAWDFTSRATDDLGTPTSFVFHASASASGPHTEWKASGGGVLGDLDGTLGLRGHQGTGSLHVLVPENRTITAGEGLSGGGDLSANRTLAVDLDHAEISATDNSTTTSVSSAGWTQVTIFDTNGLDSGAIPDHTNDHITIAETSRYIVVVSVVIVNNAGAGHVVEFGLYRNNGATLFSNLNVHRTLASGSDKGSVSMGGIISGAANDTIELWVTSDSASSRNVTVEDVTLSIIQVP